MMSHQDSRPLVDLSDQASAVAERVGSELRPFSYWPARIASV